MRSGLMGLISVSLMMTCLVCTAQPTRAFRNPGNYPFHSLDNSNGLLSSEIFSMAQDATGYIWIGTTRGVQRYDGTRFVDYTRIGLVPDETMGVSGIFPDGDHNRLLYNPFFDRMMQRNIFTDQSSWIYPATESRADRNLVYTASDSGTWLFQQYRVIKTSADGNVREGIAIIQDPSLASPYFSLFIQDRKRRQTWICEPSHGLLLLDDRLRRVIRTGDELPQKLFKDIAFNPLMLRTVRLDSRGNLWLIGWSDIIYRYNTDSHRLYSYSLADVIRQEHNQTILNGWVNAVFEDHQANFWLATAHAGLLQYHPEEDAFSYILNEPGNITSIQYNLEINSLMQDREDNIWVGTDKGVSVFNPYRQYFRSLEKQAGGVPAPQYEVGCAIQNRRGQIVVGTHGGGIDIYDTAMKTYSRMGFSGKDDNLVWSMIQRSNDETWVGCQHGVIHQLDKNNQLMATFEPPALQHSTIRSLAEDRRGRVYLGLHSGRLITRDPLSGAFSGFDNRMPLNMKLSAVLTMLPDNDRRCWAGTVNGLAVFDPVLARYTAFFKPALNVSTACYSILSQNDSTLLVAMENAGLQYFHINTGTFTALPINMGQQLWSAYSMRRDATGILWFTTDFQVCRFEPVRGTLLASSPQKGIINSSFQQGNIMVSAPGTWFTSTRTELIGFDPAQIGSHELAGGAVHITGISIFDRPLLADSAISKGAIELSYRDNFLGIGFSNLSFSGVVRPKYFYRLDGVDQQWVDAGNRSTATYTDLPPGNYRFRVTTGSPGNEQAMVSLQVNIIPPFWVTTWFRIACALLASALIFLLVRWYVNRIRKDADLKRKIATTEMMALRAQMNPHFIFNCINSIDAMIQDDDKYHATIYLNKFARLIRSILDSSRQETIAFRKDLEALQLYVDLERFRSGNNFIANIRMDEHLMDHEFKVPPLIIQPFVENAILHGLRNREDGGGVLSIDITRNNDQLVYVIEDNGVGRLAAGASSSANPKHRSHGMEITDERLRLFNRESDTPVTITDLQQDGQASGTRVRVSLKIKYA